MRLQLQESSRQLTIREAKLIIKPPDSSVYAVGFKDAQKGPRVLRMADYFRENQRNDKTDNVSDNDYKSDQEGK